MDEKETLFKKKILFLSKLKIFLIYFSTIFNLFFSVFSYNTVYLTIKQITLLRGLATLYDSECQSMVLMRKFCHFHTN
jgi:hypothetical protein